MTGYWQGRKDSLQEQMEKAHGQTVLDASL